MGSLLDLLQARTWATVAPRHVRIAPVTSMARYTADHAGKTILDGVGRGQYNLYVLAGRQKYFFDAFEAGTSREVFLACLFSLRDFLRWSSESSAHRSYWHKHVSLAAQRSQVAPIGNTVARQRASRRALNRATA